MPYAISLRALVPGLAVVATVLQAGCSGATACTEVPAGGTTGTAAASVGGEDVPLSEPIHAPQSITVRSDDFSDRGAMPPALAFNGFGCTGDNRSPSLAWSGAPEATLSYAIVVHDPDAPTGVGFFHWLVYDIAPTTTSLPAGGSTALAAGAVDGRSDFGSTGYGGPCPPHGSGQHRYVFTVYALDVASLGLPAEGSGGAMLRFMLAQHTLGFGRIIGTFER